MNFLFRIPEYSGANRRGWNWIPGNPEFRVELVFALNSGPSLFAKSPLAPSVKVHISQEIDILIRVNIGMFEIRTNSR